MNGEGPEAKTEEQLKAELTRLRAEKAALQAELQGKKFKEPFPWRNLVAWILVVLAFIMAIAATPASWGHDYLMDTDRFVATVAPLVRDDAVAQALSERAASRLVEALDVQDRLDRVLPDEITFIAGPITSGVETLAQRTAKAILQSDQFYWVWEKMLRFAHSTAVATVRGEGALELTGEGDIVLDIGDLLVELKARLVDAGLTFLEKVPVPVDAGTVVLFTADELGLVQGLVHLLDTLNWVLPALAVLFLVAAVLISTDRRRFLMVSGITLALGMAISLIGLNYTRNYLLDQIKVPTNLTAAQVIWAGVVDNLVQIQAGILALGVVVSVGAAVAGPYKWALWLRNKTANLFVAWQDRRRRGVKEPGPVGKFVEAHKMALRIGGLVLILFILLLLPEVKAGAVIGSAIALVVYWAVIELVRSPAPPEGTKETAAGDEGEGGYEKGEEKEQTEKKEPTEEQ
ncbi:MAG: hypothetical protein JW854_10990 [Actinobacteria bacterium]|nr:hypothetical protein [Actinomycetota bacterium]